MNQQPPIPLPTGDPLPSYKIVESNEIRTIAAAQKLLLWAVLATSIIFIVRPLALFAWGFQIWAVYNMGKLLRLSNVWLWVIGTMIPLVGLFVLLRMNAKATLMLQGAGVRVGLMGAKMKDLPN